MENVTSTDLPIYHNYGQYLRTSRIINYFATAMCAVIFLLGMTGNGLVIWITGFRMRKTVTTVYFLNLAIADLVFLLFIPLTIVNWYIVVDWPIDTFTCKLSSTSTYLNLYTRILLLTAISIDRCISVVLPVWSNNHRTTRLSSMVVTVVWFFAFLSSLPFAVFTVSKQYNNYTFCFTNFILTDYAETEELIDRLLLARKVAILTEFTLCFVIPFIVIVTCYTMIALRLHKKHNYMSRKPLKIIIAVLISFAVCWLPYYILNIFYLFNFDMNDLYIHILVNSLQPITITMYSLNSCINPFLYVIIGNDFKEVLKSSFKTILEKAFSDDTTRIIYTTKKKRKKQFHVY